MWICIEPCRDHSSKRRAGTELIVQQVISCLTVCVSVC